jgi:cytochrome P450
VPFRPRDVEERTQGMIPRLADDLIDGFVERGEADLFHEDADPMSVRSLCFMLGLDAVPWQDILRWNEGLMPGLAIFEGDPEKQAPADEAAAALHAAIGDVLDRLADDPGRLGALLDAAPRGMRTPHVAGADRRQRDPHAERRAAGATRCDRPDAVGVAVEP